MAKYKKVTPDELVKAVERFEDASAGIAGITVRLGKAGADDLPNIIDLVSDLSNASRRALELVSRLLAQREIQNMRQRTAEIQAGKTPREEPTS